jgi:phosphonatase-like hydrolase
MAGTTVAGDDGVNASFQAALAAAGLEVSPEAIQAIRGLPKREAIRLLIERASSDPTASVNEIHDDFVARMVRFYTIDPGAQEVPGTSDTFRELKAAGIRIAVNTGFSRSIAQPLIDRLGWETARLLDASITSDEVPQGRPHPDMIRALMRRLGVEDPRQVAKVGDTPVDLQEGVNAGCGLVIGVTQGTHSREQLEPYPHTHLIETVAELPGLLRL